MQAQSKSSKPSKPSKHCDDLSHLEVIAIQGQVFDRGDVLEKSSVEAWTLEDICYCPISSKAAAQKVATRTQLECWVVDRNDGNRVTFRFKPGGVIDLPY